MAKKSEKPSEPQPEAATGATHTAPKAHKSRAKKAASSEASEVKPQKAAKPRKARVKIKSESGEELEVHVPVGEPFTHSDDPIGDVTDGEGQFAAQVESELLAEAESDSQAEMAAQRADTAESALDGTLENEPAQSEPEENEAGPTHLDRLQKILSQAGIASRRRAEELITEGRVQVNGQVVNQLGAKADPMRDHIRVDGKLISGAERHRYFVLNKPKGYVTTVSDPEGRPTVMEFFTKMRERLYPVGRLDYQSEGLLLVTNDGELANQLTRAASGIEKTYLVKIAGQPTEEQLDQLRSGVAIDRERPGSGKVHTAPAEIRQVRRGDNPWFEVVLIEGRNRELRKMFSAIGHFVEKIRRVGYGPLVLDLEPGKFRELLPEEIAALRLAAEGKLKPRRPKFSKMLPKEAGRVPEQRASKPKPQGARPFREHTGQRERSEWKPREQRFGQQGSRGERPRSAKPEFRERGERRAFGSHPRGPKSDFGKPQFERPQSRPRFDREEGEFRPRQQSGGRRFSFRPQQRESGQSFEDRPRHESRSQGDRPNFKRGGFGQSEEPRKRFDKPAGKSFGKPGFKSRGGEFKPRSTESSDRPSGRFDRSGGSRSQGPARRWNQDRDQDSAPFRGEQKPHFGAKGKPAGNRSRPSFGSKPGFKRSGPPGPRGNRPGGRKRG
ncbi:MAG TPA: pseudouridine synthase [Terracidiphilus sp.]|nr:pseudouridine synthase [Terracidiphilus sp.]